MRYLVTSFSLLFFYIAIVSNAWGQEILLMPEELYSIAKNNNCEQVKDYYLDRPGPLMPLYIYGVAIGDPADSAAFWCSRKKGANENYILMFMLRDVESGARFAGEIVWVNFPKALKLLAENVNTLERLTQLDSSQKKLPSDKHFYDRGIKSEYDGVEEMFINKGGKWFFKQRH